MWAGYEFSLRRVDRVDNWRGVDYSDDDDNDDDDDVADFARARAHGRGRARMRVRHFPHGCRFDEM